MPSCSDSHIFLFSCHFLSGFIFPSFCLKSFESDPVTKQGIPSLLAQMHGALLYLTKAKAPVG